MAKESVFNLQGLQLGLNPLGLQNQGQFTRLINVDTDPVGVKRKRAGYITLLGTPDNATIDYLGVWKKQDNSTFWLYRASGGTLYYSAQGTGPWTVTGNGTFTAGSPLSFTVLNETMIGGDGVTTTRHSTDGTSFTNTSGAPASPYWAFYQNRAYAAGTNSFLFYSTTGDATNWQTTGTSDSSSIAIPGPGRPAGIMKVADRIVVAKTSGNMHRWDGDTLVDLATKYGPTSFRSISEMQGARAYLNRLGYQSFDGNAPTILSNAIERQVYNDSGSAISGGTFNNASSVVYRKQWLTSIGNTTDDFTGETVTNCLQNYNYFLNEWSNYSFGTPVATLGTFTDANGNDQLVFGDNNGQVYQYGGTATSDNGLPIQSIMEYIYHDGVPNLEKEFSYAWFFFNPGCEARVQIAVGDTYTQAKKNWVDLGAVTDGIAEFKFSGERGRLLFVKITDNSTTSRFSFYGMSCDYDPVSRR